MHSHHQDDDYPAAAVLDPVRFNIAQSPVPPADHLSVLEVATRPGLEGDMGRATCGATVLDDDLATLDSVRVQIDPPSLPSATAVTAVASPPPPPMPLQQREMSRARSLSRVFNSVPKDRPTYAR
jgi:hypothetical protein